MSTTPAPSSASNLWSAAAKRRHSGPQQPLRKRGGSVLWQAIAHEVGDAARRRWVEVRQHRDYVAALRINLQIAVHSRSPATMTEVAKRGVCVVIHKSKRVFHPARR